MARTDENSEPGGGTGENDSGVDKLLSRFGPVPASDDSRRVPGPRPAPSAQVKRPGPKRSPAPGPNQTPAETPTAPIVDGGAAAAANTVPIGSPSALFDEPHDSVFGGSPVAVQTAEVPEPPVEPASSVAVLTLEEPDPEPVVEVIDRRDWVRAPRRTGPVLRFLMVAAVLLIGASVVTPRVSAWWGDQYDPPGEPGASVEFAIPAGATANDVTQDLFAEGVIANPTLFRYWLTDNADGDFLAGEYTCLQENMSFEEALDCLGGQGPVPPSFFSVTIPEGLRLTEIIDVLNAENTGFDKAGLRRDLLADLVSVDLEGVPEFPVAGSPDPTNSGLEGLLFPATYQINEDDEEDTLDILRRMADTMEARYQGLVEESGRAAVITELGLTDYEVIILASLIEEEYQIEEDLGRISRVIYNRLIQGESLGIDASSCYAAQKPCADLNADDLASDSPWNTRNTSNLGLPPTPIAAPSEAALRAALQPTEGEWLFYVLTDENGGHTFSNTIGEHNAAVQICRERGLGC